MSPLHKRMSPLAMLLVGLALAGCATRPAPALVEVSLAALNDFHGYLQPSPFTAQDAAGEKIALKAGGVEALSGVLAELRRQDPQLLFVGVGDMIGGSPPLSSMWADEPSLTALKMLGMNLSTVGNHELDQGIGELERQIAGGCDSPRPEKACQFDGRYTGSGFAYLSANLEDTAGQPVLPAYRIEQAHGARIAFVGAVLEDVASVVTRQGMAGLSATDEADAINAQVPALLAQNVDAIVAVVHQGGTTPEAFDKQDCSQLSGDVVDIARRLDPHIKVLLSAHTHQGYLCKVGDVLVAQGASYGRLVTHLTLDVDTREHRLRAVRARNLLVDPARYPGEPAVTAFVRRVEARSQALLGRPVARLAASEVPVAVDANGESPMGGLIADAQLAATAALGAQVALMNRGGVRAGLTSGAGGWVDYGQLAAVQPFNNTLVILTLSGEQLYRLLEQQWQSTGFNPLQPSSTFTYAWVDEAKNARHVAPGSLRIDGQPVRADALYKITVNSFMADGGDNFTVLAQAGKRLDTGLNDLEALILYLQGRDRAGIPAGQARAGQRIQKVRASLAGSDQ